MIFCVLSRTPMYKSFSWHFHPNKIISVMSELISSIYQHINLIKKYTKSKIQLDEQNFYEGCGCGFSVSIAVFLFWVLKNEPFLIVSWTISRFFFTNTWKNVSEKLGIYPWYWQIHLRFKIITDLPRVKKYLTWFESKNYFWTRQFQCFFCSAAYYKICLNLVLQK